MSDGTDPRYRIGCMRSSAEIFDAALQELETPIPSTKINLWPHFNEVTGGFRPREFTILCGATGTGKTTFLANLSMHLLLQDVKHFVASVETGDTDFMKRVISALCEEDLNTGDSHGIEKIKELYDRTFPLMKKENLMLSVFDNRVTCDQLIADLEIAHARYGCKIALLDNLNFFMEVSTEKNQIIEMDETIHSLIMFCKRIDMHVVMVMHPKKTDHGRVESEFDIKGSSTAVQEAHNVFLFNRPKTEDAHRFHQSVFRELKIAKLRRRGKHVGRRIMYKNFGSCYSEDSIL